MRHEHKSHVVVISLMLLVILFVFGWVLMDYGSRGGITTSLSGLETTGSTSYTGSGYSQAVSLGSSLQTEKQILFAFLIILAGLGIFYLVLKIGRHFREK